jgi:hypothetical protein
MFTVVTNWMRADVDMWIAIVNNWRGTSVSAVLAARRLGTWEVHFVFDTSPLFGIGIICISTGEWISVPFTEQQLRVAFVSAAHSSTTLESFGLLAIPIHFPDRVRGTTVHAITDAKNVETIARKGFSTEPITDDIFRMHAALMCNLDTIISVTQVSREHNKLADALSKNEIAKFRRLADATGLSVRASARTPRSAPPWLSPIGPSASL